MYTHICVYETKQLNYIYILMNSSQIFVFVFLIQLFINFLHSLFEKEDKGY